MSPIHTNDSIVRPGISAYSLEVMRDLKLVLKFQLAGETRHQVRGASRIKVDGRGGLLLYGMQNEGSERIDLGRLQSLSLLGITPANTISALPN
jgi:hypothetical protein